MKIYINPKFGKTNYIFNWITKLFSISNNLDPSFDIEQELNRLIIEKGYYKNNFNYY